MLHFPHNVWRKIFLLLYSINGPSFIVWLPLLCEILGNICIAIVCQPGSDVMNLESDLIFSLSYQVVFPTWPKSRDKNLNILGTKRGFKMK